MEDSEIGLWKGNPHAAIGSRLVIILQLGYLLRPHQGHLESYFDWYLLGKSIFFIKFVFHLLLTIFRDKIMVCSV